MGTSNPNNNSCPRSQSAEDSVNEATEQTVANRSKLGTALDAVFVKQMHDIANDEVETQREWRNKSVDIGGGSSETGGSRHSDLIVADSMNFSYPQQPPQRSGGLGPVAAAVLAAGLTGGAALFVPAVLDAVRPQPAPQATAPAVHPTDVTVDDLNLRVDWWVDENGDVQTKVVEEK